jgi:hypothetical protein
MDVCLLCLSVVLSVGRGLCDGLITRPEEFYRVSVCDQETPKGALCSKLGTTGKKKLKRKSGRMFTRNFLKIRQRVKMQRRQIRGYNASPIPYNDVKNANNTATVLVLHQGCNSVCPSYINVKTAE